MLLIAVLEVRWSRCGGFDGGWVALTVGAAAFLGSLSLGSLSSCFSIK